MSLSVQGVVQQYSIIKQTHCKNIKIHIRYRYIARYTVDVVIEFELKFDYNGVTQRDNSSWQFLYLIFLIHVLNQLKLARASLVHLLNVTNCTFHSLLTQRFTIFYFYYFYYIYSNEKRVFYFNYNFNHFILLNSITGTLIFYLPSCHVT